jgi:hypothetical protein
VVRSVPASETPLAGVRGRPNLSTTAGITESPTVTASAPPGPNRPVTVTRASIAHTGSPAKASSRHTAVLTSAPVIITSRGGNL